MPEQAPRLPPSPLAARAEEAVRAGVENLAQLQALDGAWPGDYGGPMFLLPMYVALAWVAHHLPEAERAARMVAYFKSVQRSDGSIGLHAEASQGSMFTSTLCYVALRLLGVNAEDPACARLREWIAANGSPLGAASWGKFTLCLLGLYDWRGIHPVLPELWLLPRTAPLHPSHMWCHSRQVYLPMAWLYGTRSTAPDGPLLQALREELYGGQYAKIRWERHRDTVAQVDNYRPASTALKTVNIAQDQYERLPFKPTRQRSLEECLRHIRYEDQVTHDLDIGPVNAVLNMMVHHFRGEEGAADLARGWPKFDRYLWEGHDGLKMQGYNSSELWDTAFAVQAVLATRVGAGRDDLLKKAYGFLRDNQILEDVPEAALHYRHISRGGWPFSDRAHGWPITDCTAEGLKCALSLAGRFAEEIPAERLKAAVGLILSWQNDDGGWATYEKQRGGTWLESLNPSQVFGDIMVDSSHVECTSACIQALVAARRRFPGDFALNSPIRRGVEFLRARQKQDGSFEGAWAVCFTYGTWFGVSGLLSAGASKDDLAVRQACQFLLARQRPDGSWSEHGDSCRERRWIDGPEGHAAQTSWALLALVRAGCTDSGALERAAQWLCEHQAKDGGWPREALVGVFNRSCLINYDNYRHVFPVWALGEWLQARHGGA